MLTAVPRYFTFLPFFVCAHIAFKIIEFYANFVKCKLALKLGLIQHFSAYYKEKLVPSQEYESCYSFV